MFANLLTIYTYLIFLKLLDSTNSLSSTIKNKGRNYFGKEIWILFCRYEQNGIDRDIWYLKLSYQIL